MRHWFTASVIVFAVVGPAVGGPGFSPATPASAQSAAAGEAVYKQRCAQCHDAPDVARAPSRQSLNARSEQAIIAALSPGGVMATEGEQMSGAEKQAVARFLAATPSPTPSPSPSPSPAAPPATVPSFGGTATKPPVYPDVGRCATPAPAFTVTQQTTWNGWGNDTSNGRFQPADRAGLNAQNAPKLALKWAYGFVGATTATSQPAVIAGRVYVGSDPGGLHALDLKTGCWYWRYNSESGVRSAPVVARISDKPERWAVMFGDLKAFVYALDAQTGEQIWKVQLDTHPSARITGAPSVHGNRLFVPVSSFEEGPAARPNYPCCTFRGSVAALDTATGKTLWQTYTIAEKPQIVGKNSAGTPLWKPAGVGVWSTPTIDPERNLVYIGTGNSYTQPAAPMSDSIVALAMDTGEIRWFNQITANDAFVVGCRAGNQNCPENVGPDHDFGSSPILRTVGGRRLLLAGQKSGVMFALDPDARGKIVWQQRVGKGSELGGIEWGPAADLSTVYIAISDVIAQGLGVSEQAGGLHALRIADGQRVWYTAAPPLPPNCKGAGCSSAQSAAISVIPGVVFSGSVDGHLRGYSTTDGKIIWDFDTMRDFETTNGVKAAGGSIDAGGPVIVNGMVLTNSGYGRWRGKPGNVLLAFGIQ
jgi:polyvinyl alcohol dehydrogenase (cytochrome)